MQRSFRLTRRHRRTQRLIPLPVPRPGAQGAPARAQRSGSRGESRGKEMQRSFRLRRKRSEMDFAPTKGVLQLMQ